MDTLGVFSRVGYTLHYCLRSFPWRSASSLVVEGQVGCCLMSRATTLPAPPTHTYISPSHPSWLFISLLSSTWRLFFSQPSLLWSKKRSNRKSHPLATNRAPSVFLLLRSCRFDSRKVVDRAPPSTQHHSQIAIRAILRIEKKLNCLLMIHHVRDSRKDTRKAQTIGKLVASLRMSADSRVTIILPATSRGRVAVLTSFQNVHASTRL